MKKIVLVEDQTLLRDALASLLSLHDEIDVVAQFANGKTALQWLVREENHADIVVTDIEMPEVTGLELAEALHQQKIPCKTVILTTFARAGYLRRAMDAGVVGYLLKESPTEELAEALHRVAMGQKVIAPELMVNAWMEQDPLNDKERKALRLAHQGLTTEQIAEKLFLSAGTVRNYLSNAASKLNARNRIDAARIAHQNGWL